MITENREVEALVEKFGEALSQEYSKNTDRSAIIIDYVMGKAEQFPDLLPDSMQYAYRSMDLFEKLAKKDDSDVFFVQVHSCCEWDSMLAEAIIGRDTASRSAWATGIML